MEEVRAYPFGPSDRLVIDPMYYWLQEHEPLSRVKLPHGYESTASQIANFTYALLQYPDQLALLCERPELIPNAVEELMRWTPLLAKHIANRDPRAYAGPPISW